MISADERIMDILSIALQGMNRAQSQLENAASNVARSGGSVSANGIAQDTVDISQQMISMMSAKNDFESNAKTVEVADQMTKTVIDMLA